MTFTGCTIHTRSVQLGGTLYSGAGGPAASDSVRLSDAIRLWGHKELTLHTLLHTLLPTKVKLREAKNALLLAPCTHSVPRLQHTYTAAPHAHSHGDTRLHIRLLCASSRRVVAGRALLCRSSLWRRGLTHTTQTEAKGFGLLWVGPLAPLTALMPSVSWRPRR